ncbi:hypothetical protein POM88_039670 [Heracleum sosnowskyi]|uniref:COBRA C-terminal domain-containing protein n=1 Tax=Heracleum sosnowskyi TaxID=360622 RepID=A0AAD8HD41_9APIA|nr:hypothetical protein POM88_039670 [Heracleum sosnowskyi]
MLPILDSVPSPPVRCTGHMCPIQVHWHLKLNDKDNWRVNVTVTNLNFRMNYTQWNLVVQHPNFNNRTQIFSFNYTDNNDTAMLWGVKKHNENLLQAGPLGNVQSDILFQKDSSTFTLGKGWPFPQRIYFNGDDCIMPNSDSYPYLSYTSSPDANSPNTSSRRTISPLVGASIGGSLGGIFLLIIGFLLFRRRRKKSNIGDTKSIGYRLWFHRKGRLGEIVDKNLMSEISVESLKIIRTEYERTLPNNVDWNSEGNSFPLKV